MNAVHLSRELGHLFGYLSRDAKQYVLKTCATAASIEDCPADVQKWLADKSTIPADKLSDLAKMAVKQLANKSASADTLKFVPGTLEVKRAKSRLAILPNPNDPRIDDPTRYVESPWRVVEVPTVNPSTWDLAKPTIVNLDELLATDPFLDRKRVKKHIESMGQALTPNRSYPLVVDENGHKIIIDGHHRLMASWLLGQEQAAVWLV